MNKLKYGVIGLGWFGEIHTEVLSTLPNVELVAVCTRREWRAKEVSQKYNVPKIYTDYNKLLADKDIEAVNIVTHVKDHLAPTLAALKAGKHVFLEKPMAVNGTECDMIIEEAKKTDKSIMVGHICRFDPRYFCAKKSIESGEIGKIVYMYARRNIPASVSASPSVLPNIDPLLGDGIHDTDLMLWFSRLRVKTVYAQTLNVRGMANPDLGAAICKFEDGAIGMIESVWFLPDGTPYDLDARMEIIGTKGAIYIDGPGQTLAISTEKGLKQPETTYWPKYHEGRTGALKEELSYFVNCVLRGEKPAVITLEESKSAVEVMVAAQESAKTGKVVTLK